MYCDMLFVSSLHVPPFICQQSFLQTAYALETSVKIRVSFLPSTEVSKFLRCQATGQNSETSYTTTFWLIHFFFLIYFWSDGKKPGI